MRDADPQCRITRVVDGDHEVQLAQLEAVMQRIQAALCAASCEMPAAQRTYIGNALLNLAVGRILGEEGPQRSASLLMRFGNAVQAQPLPVRKSHPIGGARHG